MSGRRTLLSAASAEWRPRAALLFQLLRRVVGGSLAAQCTYPARDKKHGFAAHSRDTALYDSSPKAAHTKALLCSSVCRLFQTTALSGCKRLRSGDFAHRSHDRQAYAPKRSFSRMAP
ncbi:hypothetical protein DV515_00017575 [Chloebia gouldiae]|uniref:Uncharacterized protein n=1 Tax=Chloebia gouldiae TaxID=44316 RepID=A0A3L8Q9X0_CHLGU|nr:hypothetical protein DV515_00017575 [Chloebia gouldiae]